MYFIQFVSLRSIYISLTACVSGYFKAAQGDHKCLQCPINSRTTSEGATNCVCRNGYYRTDSDPQQMPCTSMCASAFHDDTLINLSVLAANGNLNHFIWTLIHLWSAQMLREREAVYIYVNVVSVAYSAAQQEKSRTHRPRVNIIHLTMMQASNADVAPICL